MPMELMLLSSCVVIDGASLCVCGGSTEDQSSVDAGSLRPSSSATVTFI